MRKNKQNNKTIQNGVHNQRIKMTTAGVNDQNVNLSTVQLSCPQLMVPKVPELV